LRSIVLLEPVRTYIEALVHPSARSDALTASRHRAFIAVRLLGGLIVLAAIPLYLALRGAPTVIEAFLFAWLVAPLLVVGYLSRTGNFERAHLLSAGVLTGFVALLAGATGGIASFAAPWLAVIPFESALSASRRVVLTTIALALSAVFLLGGLGAADLLPSPSPPRQAGVSLAHLLGVLSSALYAGAVALGASALARSSDRLKLITDSRYHLLAQNMTDMITRHSKNGAVTFISPAAGRLVGVPPAALLGHGLFEHVHVADRPAFLTAITEAARGRAAAVEYRLRRGRLAIDGEPSGEADFIWVETRCRALGNGRRVSDAEPGEVVAVTRDITRNKEDALELERAHANAERANEAKSRFLATVSHELRTPLNAIIGFSEMLTNESALALDPARRRDYARVIHESGQHLLAVVNSILDVSRIEAGHFEIRPEHFAIGALVESCYEMMLLRAEQAGVELDVEIAPDLPAIFADRIAIRQVLINLISNAVKFTPRGGSVKISAQLAGPDFLLTVTDTGIGISESDLAHVGSPFFQAASSYDRPYEGTGLGLSVVKGLVGLHGGKFEIKSRLGEGTRVLVRIPREHAALRPGTGTGAAERLPAPTAAAEIEKVKRSA
jgi:cell cycle sensor histidine kinase DivJ